MDIRTFIGVAISEESRLALAEMQKDFINSFPQGIKWVDPNLMHVTVKFLGDIAEQEISKIKEITKEALRGTKPFSYTVKGFGVFPKIDRPTVFWAGTEGAQEIFTHLHRQLEEKLVVLRIKADEEQYQPHITIGRIRYLKDKQTLQRLMLKYSPRTFGSQIAVSEVVLFRSDLKPSGPLYTQLARITLG